MPYWKGLAGSTAPVSTQIETGLASSLATAAAITPPPANAILGVAAGIAAILAAAGVGSGCGQTCIQATNLVNQAEPAFLANLQQYENGQITQAQAQATYNNLWQALQVACAAIPGAAGQKCISDRQQGACTWKATGTPPTPYSPADGACWDWYSAYYVPLTYPPTNAPATSTVAAAAGSVLSSVGVSSSLAVPLMIGAAVLVAWLAVK